MTDLKAIGKLFDEEYAPLAKSCLEDPNVDTHSKYYISESVFYIEHDLADGRNPALRVQPVSCVLNLEKFYAGIYKAAPEETVKKLRALGETAKKLMELCTA